MSRKLSRAEQLERDIADAEARAKERADERERNAEIYDLIRRIETFGTETAIKDAVIFLLEQAKQ